MTSIDLGPEGRRRQPNKDVVDRAAVRSALADIVDGIETLQREAALVQALVARPDKTRDQIMPRIVTLGQNVRQTSVKLESVVAWLPERQREHGRVLDVRRTLQMLAASIPRLTK